MSDKERLKATIEACEADVRQLEARYGTGVRPAWVGDEIAMQCMRAEAARTRLTLLEREEADDAA